MTVPAAIRTLELIEAFAKARRPLTISMISKITGIPHSSCHGLVKTLERCGYLAEFPEYGGYYFTKTLEQHVDHIKTFDPIPHHLQVNLSLLRETTGETVVLARLNNNQAMYLDVLESPQSVRFVAHVGDKRPLHASAAGKALLSTYSPEQRNSLLAKTVLKKSTPFTTDNREALLKEIERGRKKGWFISREEFIDGVIALAISRSFDSTHYAIAISGPSTRMEKNLKKNLEALVSIFT